MSSNTSLEMELTWQQPTTKVTEIQYTNISNDKYLLAATKRLHVVISSLLRSFSRDFFHYCREEIQNLTDSIDYHFYTLIVV